MSEDPNPDYYKPELKVRLSFSFGVLGVLLFEIILLIIAFPDKFAALLGLFLLYMAPGFGKESITPLILLADCPWQVIVIGILTIDMTLGIIISMNFDLLIKVPLIGKVILFFTNKTSDILRKHPWIQGFASAGLFLFMFIPFMGSSAINTSLIGRVLSIHPKILLPVIFVGSLAAELFVMAAIFGIVNLWLKDPVYAVIGVIAIAVISLVIWRVWKVYTNKKLSKSDK